MNNLPITNSSNSNIELATPRFCSSTQIRTLTANPYNPKHPIDTDFEFETGSQDTRNPNQSQQSKPASNLASKQTQAHNRTHNIRPSMLCQGFVLGLRFLKVG
ncbi:hypothetical protein Droror1_Dr00009720 [Drosera rotundifolia]